jgi:hypothetical protein
MDELEAGRYRLLERIGSGGMAEVWRARDERSGNEVALKRLHAEALADPAARERFAREIDALRAIEHPFAVRVMDAAVDERATRLVMELVPGGSLRDRLARGPMGEAAASRMGADVASVLAAAHEAGVVHRDVTPANILFDDRDRARLVDFGVATVPVEWGRDAVTATTDVVGTLRFIAPEVLEGGQATPAADVWALGAVLWEAVQGRPPFEAGSPAALLEARRGPAPALPGDPVLASLVASMLAREPSDRPAAAVAGAGLQRIAADLESADGEVTAVMPAVAAGAAATTVAVDVPVAWTAPAGPEPVAARTSGATTSRALWAPVAGSRPSRAPAPGPTPRQAATVASRGRLLAGATIVVLAILAVAVVGNPGLTGLPSGDSTSAPPALTSPAASEPPRDDPGQNAKEPPGRANGAGNGNNGNGGGNGNNGNGNNGNGKGPDKGKHADD